jgi:hypothetical protein
MAAVQLPFTHVVNGVRGVNRTTARGNEHGSGDANMIRFMRSHPIVTGVFGTLAALMALVLLVRFVLLDFTGRPFCHKQIYLALRIWDSDNETGFYPNAAGMSRDSLAMLRDHLAVRVGRRLLPVCPGSA